MRNTSFFIVEITSFIELYFWMLFPITRILAWIFYYMVIKLCHQKLIQQYLKKYKRLFYKLNGFNLIELKMYL